MTEKHDDLDLEARELCPDDACIGVLGRDGICPECGRTRDGGRASPATATAEAAFAAPPTSAADHPGPEAFDEDRELCPDDACIGLIGNDGRCRECGRSRQS